MNDYNINISLGHSRLSKNWKVVSMTWSELVKRCSECVRTSETVAEYKRMSAEERANVKDTGGLVGAVLREAQRKNRNVVERTLITLDLDYCNPDVADRIREALPGVAYLTYTTHTHTAEKPRLRLIILPSRPMDLTEYEALARKVAERVGIEMFDTTTYEPARLFYWPSASKDGAFDFFTQSGEPLDVDKALGEYRDYKDVSSWPIGDREGLVVMKEMRKAGDPLAKPGIIGLFCRAYSIHEAIEKFIPEVYVPTVAEGRYTYSKGSVAGGVVTYEDKWLYSHHDHDPLSRKLTNAYDMVRIHLFGMKDEGSKVTDVNKLPSALAMAKMAENDPTVRKLRVEEWEKQGASDFDGVTDEDDQDESEDPENDWRAQLSGKSTISDAVLVLENAKGLKGHLWYDEFRRQLRVENGLPWNESATHWTDMDESNLREFLERKYHITGKEKIFDAIQVVAMRHRRHPLREYFDSLKWDGVPRLETLIIDFVGAEDTPLNRAITRIHFTAAVRRVREPGCKYDLCPILRGNQGAGKSELFKIMAGEYSKEGLTSMEGKEGADQLRGVHMVELGELDCMKRTELSAVKHFITTTVDEYRAAYARHKERHPRQCVFSGTTNESHFLKDDQNRRFPVIEVNRDLSKMGELWFDKLRAVRDQLWAEAAFYERRGDEIFLGSELEAEMIKVQQGYRDDDLQEIRPILEQFLETRLPIDWPSYSLARRRDFFSHPDELSVSGTELRTRVAPAEFLCERLGKNVTDKDYKFLVRKIGNALLEMGWEKIGASRHASMLYGVVKAYERREQNSDDDEL